MCGYDYEYEEELKRLRDQERQEWKETKRLQALEHQKILDQARQKRDLLRGAKEKKLLIKAKIKAQIPQKVKTPEQKVWSKVKAKTVKLLTK